MQGFVSSIVLTNENGRLSGSSENSSGEDDKQQHFKTPSRDTDHSTLEDDVREQDRTVTNAVERT